MIDAKNLMKHLTGQTLTNPLIEFMEQHFDDFPEIHAKYLEVIAHTEKGEQLAEAIAVQTTSDLLFSAALGLKANLDHFRNPVAMTFLEVEPEIYLRESVAHCLPQYIEAQKIRDTAEANDDVIAYTTYLETIGPKLAHYFGYLLGDELLPRIVPSYQPDPLLSFRYRNWMMEYVGREC